MILQKILFLQSFLLGFQPIIPSQFTTAIISVRRSEGPRCETLHMNYQHKHQTKGNAQRIVRLMWDKLNPERKKRKKKCTVWKLEKRRKIKEMKRKLWILQRPPSTLSCRKIPRFRLFLFPRFLINQTGLQKKIKGGEEKDFTGRDIRRMMRLILEISGAIEGGLLRNLTLVCVQIPEKKKKKKRLHQME